MAEDPKCAQMRAERARLQQEADQLPGRLPPRAADQGVGPGNPDLRAIYDRLNELRLALLDLGCDP